MEFILFLSLIILTSCHPQKPPEETVLWKLPWEQQRLKQPRFIIKYNQPVEGYQVTAVCFPETEYVDRDREHELWASAILRFENEETAFEIYCEHFSDSTLFYANDREIQDGEVLHMDYTPIAETEYLDCFKSFFFKDLDFDGEKELVINNWREGYYGSSSFDVYKVNDASSHEVRPRLMTEPPFFKMYDRETEFDPVNQTITVGYSSPIEGEKRVYKRSKRQTIANNTIADEYYFKLIGCHIWDASGERDIALKGDSFVVVRSTIDENYYKR